VCVLSPSTPAYRVLYLQATDTWAYNREIAFALKPDCREERYSVGNLCKTGNNALSPSKHHSDYLAVCHRRKPIIPK